jgi:hypothetical protein
VKEEVKEEEEKGSEVKRNEVKIMIKPRSR